VLFGPAGSQPGQLSVNLMPIYPDRTILSRRRPWLHGAGTMGRYWSRLQMMPRSLAWRLRNG